MNKNDKIKNAINGAPQKEIPFSFWTHLPEIDRNPEKIAEETYSIYKKYDLDFIKTMNNGMYAVEDYGCEIDFSEVPKGGVAKITKTPVENYEDWTKVSQLPTSEAALSRELIYLKELLEKVDGEAPVIMTVFSPLTTAHKLSQGKIVDHMTKDKDQLVHKALANIAETTKDLARKAVELGAAGVYFATQMSSYDRVSEELYAEYGVPYDLEVLKGAEEGWFNAIHIHGENILFDLLKDYPVDVFNWHIGETLPEVDEGIHFTQKAVMGGIQRMDITNKNKNQIRSQIYHTIKAAEGKNLILTPGCGIRHPLHEDMLSYIKDIKIEVEKNMN